MLYPMAGITRVAANNNVAMWDVMNALLEQYSSEYWIMAIPSGVILLL